MSDDRYFIRGNQLRDRNVPWEFVKYPFGVPETVPVKLNTGLIHRDALLWDEDPRYAGMADMVNQPPHYKFENGVEVIDLTEQLNFNCGNAIKYLARAGRKDSSKTVEDLKKAEYYVKREIARVERSLDTND